MLRNTIFFLLTSLLFLNSFLCFGEWNHGFQNDSITETKLNALKATVQQVISQHQNLKVGLTLINEEGNVWLEVLGNSDQKTLDMDSENTMFRIASLSKMFVALSILMLQEEGKLSLEDEVKNIVPEVKFENQWEENHPVRIIHLLEHTTGWDEIHLVEMVHNQDPPISLKDALEFHPHSRTSRWIPGSRMAYCNSGYAVAAYIVQKVTGLKYEDYVKESIFKPLMMTHSTFFNDQKFQKWGAEIYNWEMKKVGYKNEIYRPASALNSTISDMSKILRLLLSRGSLDSIQFLKSESIDQMEIPYNSQKINIGLELGYGLANQTSIHNNFTYHGHSGAMDGGLSELAYLPEEKIGHVILMNANNGAAMQEISILICDFETGDLTPNPTQNQKYQGETKNEEGYYLAINPRSQGRFYQDLIFNIEKVEVFEDHLSMAWILPSGKSIYYPISPTEYIFGNSGKLGLVQGLDPLEGKVLYTDKFVLKPIFGFRVFGQISILVVWIFLMVVGAFISSISMIIFLRNGAKYADYLKTSILPSLTSLFAFLMFFAPRMNIVGADLLYTTPSYLSISLMLFSILFVLCAFSSLFLVFKLKRISIKWWIKWPIIALSFLHVLVSVFLIYYKVIPIITWS